MTVRLSNNARLDSLEGRMDRIEGLLETLVARTQQAPAPKAPVVKPSGVAFEALPFTGSCHDCGKALLANVLCGKCKRARQTKGEAVPSKPTVTERKATRTVPAAQVPSQAPAKGQACEVQGCSRKATGNGSLPRQCRTCAPKATVRNAQGFVFLAAPKGNQNGHCPVAHCGKFLNNLGDCKVHG